MEGAWKGVWERPGSLKGCESWVDSQDPRWKNQCSTVNGPEAYDVPAAEALDTVASGRDLNAFSAVRCLTMSNYYHLSTTCDLLKPY